MSALSNRQRTFGVIFHLLALLLAALGLWVAAAIVLALGVFFFFAGGLQRRIGEAVPLLNAAYDAALAGRVTEAERALDEVERRFDAPYILRFADLHRAAIALRRGDLEVARARAESSLARPFGALTRREEQVAVTASRGLRALVLAASGDRAGAEADVRLVRGDALASADSLARAAVAEAMLLERAGDREALAAHLDRERRLLLDHTAPRERAIVRAYQRMLAAPRTSVYRRPAPAAEHDGEEPAVADWIAKVAPGAAPFAASRAIAEDAALPDPAEAPVPEGLRRIAEERLAPKAAPRAAPAGRKVAALWVLLALLFGAIWALLSEGERAAVVSTTSPLLPRSLGLFATALFILVGVAFAFVIRRNLATNHRLSAAIGKLGRGQEAEARAELEALAAMKLPLTAAQASLHLARLAERRGDFAGALAHCDRGIAQATSQPSSRAFASMMMLPDLVAERALLLAVTDHHDKARAEMDVLKASFPSYPHLAPAELRVALVSRVRRGDLAGAARVAAARGEDVPLPQRDETLADLVRAAVSPAGAGAGEIERLDRELRSDPELAAFVAAVSPDLVARFARARLAADERRDRESEEEAVAEEEAREAEAAARA